MQKLVYWLIFPLLWLVSLLPWKLFYLFSDFVCLIVYRIVGYRKRVVTDNLRNAFPNKSEKEIKKIRGKFYTHMCDMFLEMIKSITISEKDIKKHYKFVNTDSLRKLEASGKSMVLLAGHYGSYEWSNSMELITPLRGVGVYKQIKNESFDKLVYKIRSRFGSEVIANKKIMRYALAKERENKLKRYYGLVADQAAKINDKTFWVNFLGREVPAFVGGEVLAKKLDLNMAYLKVEKVKRGYYEAEVIIISEDIKTVPDFEATEKYFKLLENQIRNQPEYYLWTHKRWKHVKT